MPDRTSIDGYRSAPILRVRQSLLTIVSQLPELSAHLTVVGGLVPSLLIDAQAAHVEPHIGTFDIDIAIELALNDHSNYLAVQHRLAQLGFQQAQSNSIRWKQPSLGELSIDIDLLPIGVGAQQLVPDLPANITGPLVLALLDRQTVTIRGEDVVHQQVSGGVAVCGPGAFIAIKAIAFADRNLPKDAYDLYYLLHYFGAGVLDVASHFGPLLKHPEAQRAFKILSNDFATDYGDGCQAVAQFLYNRPDDNLQADVAGDIQQLLAPFGGPL